MERYLVNFPPTDYDIPGGVVGRNIDTKTGLLADPGQGVRMYFHSGTEPQTSVQEKDILDPSQSDGIF